MTVEGASAPAQAGAFDHLMVLELGTAPPVGWPGMMLSDMGAKVIRIEPTSTSTGTLTAEDRRKAAHSYIDRNKRSIALDLKKPQGLDIFLKLARRADVIVEGFRPGVMKRLSASYEHIAELNERIVYCSMSGFGQDGPYRSCPAHDLNFLGMTGVLGLIGPAGARPHIPLNSVADYGGAAMHAAFGIMAALFERERTGRGQHVDISYFDTTLALLAAAPGVRTYFATGRAPSRGEGIFSGEYPYYAIYDTKDAKQLTIACTEPRLWKNFCELIGRPELSAFAQSPVHAERQANRAETAARQDIQAVISTRTRDEWADLLTDADVCFGKVLSIEEVVLDPHVIARGMITTTSDANGERVRHFGSAIKYSRTRAQPRAAGPASGEHTEAVLAELGLSAQQIRALREAGAAA